VNGWLLDTNVISELRKPRCNAQVKAWSDRQDPSAFYLSRVTIAEIRYGIERLPAGDTSREQLESWLSTELRPWFGNRILEVNEDVFLIWRRLVEKGKRQRYTFAQPDLFLAATALLHELCVVTRNVDDFARAEVSVLNPWTDTDR